MVMVVLCWECWRWCWAGGGGGIFEFAKDKRKGMSDTNSHVEFLSLTFSYAYNSHRRTPTEAARRVQLTRLLLLHVAEITFWRERFQLTRLTWHTWQR